MTPTTARHTLLVPVMTNYPLVVSKTKTAQSGHVFLACCRCGNDKIHRRLDGHLEILVPSMCAMLWDFFFLFLAGGLAILGNVEEGGSKPAKMHGFVPHGEATAAASRTKDAVLRSETCVYDDGCLCVTK